MKILHTVEYYSPSVGGAQEVVMQISERLAKRGHDVTVATSHWPGRTQNVHGGVHIKEFTISGNAVWGFSGDVEKYKDFLTGSRFDIMMNYAAQQWATDLALPLLEKISAKKVFAPCGFSGLYLGSYRDYFEKMKIWIRAYDACVFSSKNYRDIGWARENGIDRAVWIPNGAGEDEFEPKPSQDIRGLLRVPRDHFMILHVGSHTGMKGHREAIKIFKKAGIPHSALVIIGNDFGKGCRAECRGAEFGYRWNLLAKKMGRKMIVASLSRRDTVAAYKAADLFLFPSNIECSPLVLFECMASGTPFLTTDVGNAAEIIVWSQAGWLLPTRTDKNGISKAEIGGSVELVERAFAMPEKRAEMAASGRKAWRNSFTWELIVDKYENLYRSLVQDSSLPRQDWDESLG
jgi:glycosyltransferase involved in cell wall biosynthesis